MLPAVAILPFMLYQLAGFGTLHYVVSKTVNWIINGGILVLIIGSYAANRMGNFVEERMMRRRAGAGDGDHGVLRRDEAALDAGRLRRARACEGTEREGTERSESLTIRRRALARAMRPATNSSSV